MNKAACFVLVALCFATGALGATTPGSGSSEVPDSAVVDQTTEIELRAGTGVAVEPMPDCGVVFQPIAPDPCPLGSSLRGPGIDGDPIVDQSSTGGSGGLGLIMNECCRYAAQTFTAGITGKLVGINVWIVGTNPSRPFPLRLNVRTIGWAVLGERQLSVPGSDLSQFIGFDPPIPVITGKRYFITADYPSALPTGLGRGAGSWVGGTGNPYLRGQAYSSIDGSVWYEACGQPDRYGCDLHFRTYVIPNHPPECGAAVASVSELWPPDHRMVPIGIEGVTDPDGDPVTITVTSIWQDEPTGGDEVVELDVTCPDGVIEDGHAQVRAERYGRGDGRVYTLSFTARDPFGASCAGTAKVCVPHDRSAGAVCVDGGSSFDSQEGCSAHGREILSAAAAIAPATPGREGTVRYALARESRVELAVFDITGRRVATLEDGVRPAGEHEVVWNARGNAHGLYFIRLRAGGELISQRVVITGR